MSLTGIIMLFTHMRSLAVILQQRNVLFLGFSPCMSYLRVLYKCFVHDTNFACNVRSVILYPDQDRVKGQMTFFENVIF